MFGYSSEKAVFGKVTTNAIFLGVGTRTHSIQCMTGERHSNLYIGKSQKNPGSVTWKQLLAIKY